MNTVGRLIETLSSFVNGLALAFYLTTDCAFGHVSNHGTWVTVGLRRLAGSIVHFNNCRPQMIAVHLRQGMREWALMAHFSSGLSRRKVDAKKQNYASYGDPERQHDEQQYTR